MSYNPNVRDDYNALGLAQNVGFGQSPSDGQYQEMINYGTTNHLANVISDWFFPQRKEERQMGQQLIMDRLEPKARMEGLKAAGINPLTAAAGVAGTASNSPTPASSVNPVGDVAGAVGSLAGAGADVATAIDTLSSMEDRSKLLQAQAKEALANAGFSEAQTAGVLIDNKYKDEEWQVKLDSMKQQYDNSVAEFHNIKAMHESIITDIEKNMADISLKGSQSQYYDMMREKMKEELDWMQKVNNFREAHKLYIYDSNVDSCLWSMIVAGEPSSKLDSFIDIYSDYRYKLAKANEKAAAQRTWHERPSTPTEAIFYGLDEAKKKTLWNSIKGVLDGAGNLEEIYKVLFGN